LKLAEILNWRKARQLLINGLYEAAHKALDILEQE
jgi:hypothetical protein